MSGATPAEAESHPESPSGWAVLSAGGCLISQLHLGAITAMTTGQAPALMQVSPPTPTRRQRCSAHWTKGGLSRKVTCAQQLSEPKRRALITAWAR